MKCCKMIIVSWMNKLNRLILLIVLFIFSINAMEKTIPSIWSLPKPILGNILSRLYEPGQWNSCRHIIRFLRISKESYNSKELAEAILFQMPHWNNFPELVFDNLIATTSQLVTPTMADNLT